ncbi:MAG: hypothetical protein LH618_02545, partial [Saprospiraceae bacterium]|nr:hypothetical protein [Saprospiraceae bacterium]
MARLTTFSRLLITLLIVGAVFLVARMFLGSSGLLDKKVNVVDLERTDNSTNEILSSAPKNYETSGLTQLPFPSENDFKSSNATKMTYLGMGWNAQTPISYANGGANTKAGSLMAKNNIDLT